MSIATRVHTQDGRQLTYGFVNPALNLGVSASRVIDAHSAGLSNRKGESSRTLTVASDITGGETTTLDVYSWLPAAAQEMNISPDIRDYVIVPNVPIIISDVPNTNGIAFPREELLRFNVAAGRMAYKSFKAKPTFVEHDNSDHTKAKGVILDCYAAPLTGLGRNLIKVVALLAFDRTRDKQLTDDILSGKRNAYSMGASFKSFRQSDGSAANKKNLEAPLCIADGRLRYSMVEYVEGFETSSVASPAFLSAIGNDVMTL